MFSDVRDCDSASGRNRIVVQGSRRHLKLAAYVLVGAFVLCSIAAAVWPDLAAPEARHIDYP